MSVGQVRSDKWQRVGILGGTFDPVHLGHLNLAVTALEKGRLDQVIFVPAFQAPHKADKDVRDARHRLAMVRRSIKGYNGFSVSDYEVRRGGVSYSYETVRYLRKKLGEDVKLYFIVGADMVPSLPGWKHIDELAELAIFLCVNRPKNPRHSVPYKIKWIEMPEIGISSTQIRRRIRKGKSIEYLVHPTTDRYIKQHKLYS